MIDYHEQEYRRILYFTNFYNILKLMQNRQVYFINLLAILLTSKMVYESIAWIYLLFYQCILLVSGNLFFDQKCVQFSVVSNITQVKIHLQYL